MKRNGQIIPRQQKLEDGQAIKQARMGCLDSSWHRRNLAWTLVIDTVSPRVKIGGSNGQ
jgi:hypothetical protein